MIDRLLEPEAADPTECCPLCRQSLDRIYVNHPNPMMRGCALYCRKCSEYIDLPEPYLEEDDYRS